MFLPADEIEILLAIRGIMFPRLMAPATKSQSHSFRSAASISDSFTVNVDVSLTATGPSWSLPHYSLSSNGLNLMFPALPPSVRVLYRMPLCVTRRVFFFKDAVYRMPD